MLTAAPALSAMRGADGKPIIMTGSVTLGLAALGQALGEGHADEGANQSRMQLDASAARDDGNLLSRARCRGLQPSRLARRRAYQHLGIDVP
jgi:hypothetical protein